ncbi:hypothetical protein BDZ94DRAFT_305363 [Collybia nuda]|uniref:Uncharacterized protein n=1 Tax=Collybia nuda TaxID=64659 RepID=A0A9P6CKX5_9AGAR|nr:hypothetical protein BDZ94DRAFT_305363 [Collybia nuda]
MRSGSGNYFFLFILLLSSACIGLVSAINCAGADDDGSPLTGSGTSGTFVTCSYQKAGLCTYFPTDGSFSSGSSTCPQGLPQGNGGAVTTRPPVVTTTRRPPPVVTTTRRPPPPPPPPPPPVTTTSLEITTTSEIELPPVVTSSVTTPETPPVATTLTETTSDLPKVITFASETTPGFPPLLTQSPATTTATTSTDVPAAPQDSSATFFKSSSPMVITAITIFVVCGLPGLLMVF